MKKYLIVKLQRMKNIQKENRPNEGKNKTDFNGKINT